MEQNGRARGVADGGLVGGVVDIAKKNPKAVAVVVAIIFALFALAFLS